MKQSNKRLNWLRLIGIGILIFLIWKIRPDQVLATIGQIQVGLVIIVITLNLPMLAFKVARWQRMLKSSDIDYPFRSAVLVYFTSIALGLVTPGRLGEFMKAWQVSNDCHVSVAQTFPSVLADRLFDLYALLITGSLALLSLTASSNQVMLLFVVLVAAGLTLPLIFLLHRGLFASLERIASRYKMLGRFFKPDGWMTQLHIKLRQITLPVLLQCIVLTAASYSIFFLQAYLISRSLGLNITFFQAASTTVLGSLVTLIPISISGLGTREATIVTYLAAFSVPSNQALSLSLTSFVVLNVAGAVMGTIAWWIKPVDYRA